MHVHIGNKIKQLVDKSYTKGLKELTKELGFKHDTYLHRLFAKPDMDVSLLYRFAEILHVSIYDILEDNAKSIVGTPTKDGRSQKPTLVLELSEGDIFNYDVKARKLFIYRQL